MDLRRPPCAGLSVTGERAGGSFGQREHRRFPAGWRPRLWPSDPTDATAFGGSPAGGWPRGGCGSMSCCGKGADTRTTSPATRCSTVSSGPGRRPGAGPGGGYSEVAGLDPGGSFDQRLAHGRGGGALALPASARAGEPNGEGSDGDDRGRPGPTAAGPRHRRRARRSGPSLQ